MTTPDILTAAAQWHAASATPLPTAPDGTKRPGVATWKQLQQQRPTLAETLTLFNRTDSDGIGVICGAVSANLEMLELEGRAVTEGVLNQLAQAMTDHALGDLWQMVAGGYAELTPSGGIHYYYRVADAPALPNTKLARRPATAEELAAHQEQERVKLDAITDPALRARRAEKIDALSATDVPQVLIETRGEGGWSVVAPSAGRTHKTGNPWRAIVGTPMSIPAITAEQRGALHAICALFDTMPERDTHAPPPRPVSQ